MFELFLASFWATGGAGLQTPPLPQPPVSALLEVAPLPQRKLTAVAPLIVEEEQMAFVAYDTASGKMLQNINGDRPQQIASLTKILTVMLIRKHHDMDEIVNVTSEATSVGGAGIDLLLNERLSVRTLLEAAMIPSANDAAVALAVHHSGSEELFVEEMNQYAQELGLTSAKFYNATGLDVVLEDENRGVVVGNTMTANDVLTMARLALRDDFIRQAGAKTSFFGTSDDGQFSHEKPSTNQLLGTFLGVDGLKTGYTELAGQCLVTTSNRNGHQIITVLWGQVRDSPVQNRFCRGRRITTSGSPKGFLGLRARCFR